MTVTEYLRVIREQWPVMVACLAVCILGAAAISVFTPRTYSATVMMYVSAPVAGDLTSGAYEGGLLSQQRTPSYAELLTSRRVLESASAQLGLGLTADQMREKVTAAAPLQTVLVETTATDGSPDGAARLANAVSDAFMSLVAEVEQPTDPQRPPPVVPRVVERAVPALHPTSPDMTTNLAIGGLVGLLLGLGLSLLRGLLDTSLRSADRLAAATGAPVLGHTSRTGLRRRDPLIVRGSALEDYWRVRATLAAVDGKAGVEARVIMVTGPSGREGTSAAVCNLAMVMAAAGSRVLVIEANLRRPGLSEMLVLEESEGLTGVLTGRVELADAVRQSCEVEPFDVLPSGAATPDPSKLLSSQAMIALLAGARNRYDHVLVDTPAVLPVPDASLLARDVDGVVLIVRHGATRYGEAEASAAAMAAVSARMLGCVMTGAPPRSWLLQGQVPATSVPSARPTPLPTTSSGTGPEGTTVAAAGIGADAAAVPTGGVPGSTVTRNGRGLNPPPHD